MASGDNTSYSDVAVRVATGTATADSGSFTTTETVLLTATGTVVSGQTYKVSTAANVSSTVALDALICRIREDNLTGNQIDGKIVGAMTAGISGYPVLLYAEWVAPSSGSKTFVMTANRSTGSGSYQLRATSQRVCFLIVERLVQ